MRQMSVLQSLFLHVRRTGSRTITLGWNSCAIVLQARLPAPSCAQQPLLRQTCLSDPSCDLEPELSREVQPPQCPVPEKVAEKSSFRFQCHYGFGFMKAINGCGRWFLPSCKAGGTTRFLCLDFGFICVAFSQFCLPVPAAVPRSIEDDENQ